MRHVRMLGLCLVALFALGAFAAGPALAKKKTEENPYEKFNECPIGYVGPEGQPTAACVSGEAGPESFFQAGKVTVHFKKPILLRVGFEEATEGTQNVTPGRYGNSISKEAEPAPSLTEGVDSELLPETEKTRYEEYIASGKSTKVTATIELAAPATDIGLDEAAFFEEWNEGETHVFGSGKTGGPAFSFPVEIHLSNKFLGTHCYVGSDVNPIVVPFVTGETHPSAPNTPIHGSKGQLKVIGEGGILELVDGRLVNNTYAAPGVEGCGVNGGADAAINAALGLPSPAGSNTTELIGTLAVSGIEAVEEHVKQ